jgi:hypothetical protein
MKKILFMTLSLSAICLVVTVLGEDKKHVIQAGPKKEIEELTARIASLQSKVKTLEDRLAKLEKTGAIMALPQSLSSTNPLRRSEVIGNPESPSLSDAFADPSHPPKIWGEGECNGWKYYMIPLTAQNSTSSHSVNPVIIPQSPGSP